MTHGHLLAHLQSHGRPATVYNYTETGSADDYGDPAYTESSEETKVIVDRDPAKATIAWQQKQGQQASIDAEIYVDTDLTVTGPNGGERPTEVLVDGQRYEVQIVDPFADVYRLYVRRM